MLPFLYVVFEIFQREFVMATRYMLFIKTPLALILLVSSFFLSAYECAVLNDSFTDYDDTVKQASINNIPSEYYVLSYSWAPRHCARVKAETKNVGKRNHLQCGSGIQFGYILHGLWPQGKISKPGNYPRACEGDQPKIEKAILEKYLCMTPSLGLLQHEYEYHGTCMHDEALETPAAYFQKAYELHSKLNLPKFKLVNNQESINWLVENNKHLFEDAIFYSPKSQEWRICYDNGFKVMNCPKNKKPK